MKVARIYLRVSTDEQVLTRHADIEHSAAGYASDPTHQIMMDHS